MVGPLGRQYNNVGEKPTVMLYTYVDRHAGTPDKNKTKTFLVHKDSVAIAIRSLKDRFVTIVSLTLVLILCVVGVPHAASRN